MCALTALALLAGASSAIAKGHTSHGARITGVVVSINDRHHTLKLRVSAARSSQRATARAAAAGPRLVTVAFGDASVSGPEGAVAVGDDVSVTAAGSAGQTTVAASISVIGQPNGGDAGKGAALAGEVTAVDPSAQTLTIRVDSTDAQGGSQPSTVVVAVSSTTVIAVGDTDGGGEITIAGIAVGDHVVVFTQDVTAIPIAAVGILDSGQSGGDHQGGGDSPTPAPAPPVVAPTPVYDAFAGTVAGIGDGSVRVSVSGDGPLGGETVTVAVNSSTSYKGTTTNEQSFTFSDIKVGDQVRVYTTTLDPQDLVAVFIGDGQSDGSGATGGSGPPAPTPPAPSPPSSTPVRFGGVVTAVRGDGLTLTALNGPLVGQSVIVSVPSTASFQADPATQAGTSLATISVGDAVEIYTNSESSSPVS